MPKLTPDQWSSVRAEREAGSTFAAIAKRYNISAVAIVKRSQREKWSDGTDAADTVRRRANEKVNGIVTSSDPKKKDAAIDAAADEVAAVIRRHRQEWVQVVMLRQEAMNARQLDQPDAFQRAKLAKITAEMTKIQQDGERRAWGLDTEIVKSDVVVKWEGNE